VPVHGEYSFLQAHEVLAREEGVRNTKTIQNGDILGIRPGSSTGLSNVGRVALSLTFSDGQHTGDAQAMKIEERFRVATKGIVVVNILRPHDWTTLGEATYSRADATCVAEVHTRCMYADHEGDAMVKEIEEVAMRSANSCLFSGRGSEEAVREAVTGSVQRAVQRYNATKPEVVVLVGTSPEWSEGMDGAANKAKAKARAAGGTSGSGVEDATSVRGVDIKDKGVQLNKMKRGRGRGPRTR